MSWTQVQTDIKQTTGMNCVKDLVQIRRLGSPKPKNGSLFEGLKILELILKVRSFIKREEHTSNFLSFFVLFL